MELQAVMLEKLMLSYLTFLYTASRIACQRLFKEFALGKGLSWLLCESLLCIFKSHESIKDNVEINRKWITHVIKPECLSFEVL